MWCAWCLCGVCFLVGVWRCGVCRGVILAVACACAPFPTRVPRSAAGYPSSSFCVASFFTLSPTLRWSALLPGVHFSLPHLRPCVCFGIFPCLPPRSLGPLPPLLLDPLRQRKGGGVSCCGGGGLNNDMRSSLAVVGVCVVAAAVSSIVACGRVAVSWYFSIPLVLRWRPMRAWRAWGLVVRSHAQRVPCCCCCLWAPGIPLALLVCACFLRWHALIPSIHLSAVLVASSCVVSLFPPRSRCYGLVPCRVWGGVGCGSFVFVGAGWGVCCVFLPSPALFRLLLGFRRPSCLLTLVRFSPWWRPCSCSPYLVACGPLRAFVHVLSSPASFSLLAPAYLFASSRRLSCVCVRLHLKKVPTRTDHCCTPSTITRHSQGLAPYQGLHFHKE